MNHLALKNRIKAFANPVFLTVILFFLVRIFYMQRFHALIWDEAVYVSMAKYLASFGRIGLWEIFRPQLFPALLAFGRSLGMDIVILGEFISIVAASGMVYLSYLIGRNVFNKSTGILAAFLLAITPVFFLYSGYILTEIPSGFFVLLALYLVTKNEIKDCSYLLAGLFAGLAFLTRFPQGILFGVLIVFFSAKFLFGRSKKNFYPLLYASMGFLAIQLPFFVFNGLLYSESTANVYHAIFRPVILAFSHQYNPAEIPGQAFFYIRQLQNFWLVFAVIGAVFYIAMKKYMQSKANLVIIVFLSYFAYLNIIPNKQIRFSIMFLPLLCMLASYGIFALIEIISQEEKYVMARKAIIGLIVVLSVALIIPIDANYYFWRPAKMPEIVADFYSYFKELSNENSPLVILTADPTPAAYTDAKFIPIYFSLENAYKDYAKSDYDYIVYSTDVYYCAPEDEGCKNEINSFFAKVSSENELVFAKKYRARTYYIYRHPLRANQA